MLKITKEQFVKAIDAIQKGLQRRCDFDNAMQKINTSFFVSDIGNEWLHTAIELLEVAVGDKDYGYGTTISWYLFEKVEKVITIREDNGKVLESPVVMDCSTPEALYDYFERYGELA